MLDFPDDLPEDLPEVIPVDENGDDILLLDLPDVIPVDENGDDALVDAIDELIGGDLLLVMRLVFVFVPVYDFVVISAGLKENNDVDTNGILLEDTPELDTPGLVA